MIDAVYIAANIIMRAIKKYQYIPVFTPRFRLSDATLVGFEVRIKRAQRVLSANDVLKLIQSGNDNDFLDVINSHWSQWCKKAETSLYLSWELCSKTCPGDLKLFLEQLFSALPSQQLEIVLNAHDLTANEAINKVQEL